MTVLFFGKFQHFDLWKKMRKFSSSMEWENSILNFLTLDFLSFFLFFFNFIFIDNATIVSFISCVRKMLYLKIELWYTYNFSKKFHFFQQCTNTSSGHQAAACGKNFSHYSHCFLCELCVWQFMSPKELWKCSPIIRSPYCCLFQWAEIR